MSVRLGYVILALLTIGIVFVSVFPFYWMFLTSLKDEPEIFTRTPSFWPAAPMLENYASVLRGYFFRQLINSGVVALGTTFIAIFVAMLAAYALARFKLPGAEGILAGLLAVKMIPMVVLIIPIFMLMRQFGLINTYASVIATHLALTIPAAIWMIRSFLVAIPPELEDAAMIDGATRMQTFWLIIFPLAAPGLATAAVLAFITSWNELLVAMTFMQSEDMKTLPTALQQYFTEYSTEWGSVMAASTLFAVPIIIFFLFMHKRLAEGMVMGAVKG